jgi:hypothetical protein
VNCPPLLATISYFSGYLETKLELATINIKRKKHHFYFRAAVFWCMVCDCVCLGIFVFVSILPSQKLQFRTTFYHQGYTMSFCPPHHSCTNGISSWATGFLGGLTGACVEKNAGNT